jgi:epoxyqueuosine reductase
MSDQETIRQSRRTFIKTMMISGPALHFGARHLFASVRSEDIQEVPANLIYQHKTFSVRHLPELQNYIDKLKKSKKLSSHPVFQSYIKNKKFVIPPDFSTAKSIIVLAIFTPMMRINFHLDRKVHKLIMPPQYYDDGLTFEQIEAAIQNEIIQKPGYRLQRAQHVHLKLMAVHSGLGQYGRNNICFVDGMGSFVTLYSYFTDYTFPDDHWTDVSMLDACRRCRICYGICPTKAITKDNFVIDAGRCIPLYNEVAGTFPKWIRKNHHNALMGCMKCQLKCPANKDVVKQAGRLEDVTEEETRKILDGKPDKALLETLTRKLKGYYPATSEEHFPIFTRNLKVLIG